MEKQISKSLIVRFAEKKDLENINKIREQIHKIHADGRPDIFRNEFSEELSKHIYEIFADENSNIIVAQKGDDIIGFACVEYVLKPFSPYSNERKIYRVCEFGVDESSRRQGVATRLIKFTKTTPRKTAIQKLSLMFGNLTKAQ